MSQDTATTLPRNTYKKTTTTATVGAAIYIAGQLFNLGFQLLLINFAGEVAYGHIGLAHLLLTLLIFNADLGYGVYFLRQTPDSTTWRTHWKLANGHRLAAIAILIPAALLFWSFRYGTDDPGFYYLAAAAPGAILSIFNFTSPLIAAGRYRTGIALQQIVWPASFVFFLLVSDITKTESPLILALSAGASVSLAFCIQAVANFAAINFNGDLITPSYSRQGWSVLVIAFKLALLGIVGSLHDRLTPFLIESNANHFFPVYVILTQVLTGASGIINQFYRLLIVYESKRNGRPEKLKTIISLMTICASLFFLVLTVFLLSDTHLLPRESFKLALIILLGWITEIIGGFLAAVSIGRTQEASFFRHLITGIFLSTVLQLGAYEAASAGMILWGRVIGNLSIITLALRHLQGSIPWPLYLLSLIVLLITYSPFSIIWISIPALGLIVLSLTLANLKKLRSA